MLIDLYLLIMCPLNTNFKILFAKLQQNTKNKLHTALHISINVIYNLKPFLVNEN